MISSKNGAKLLKNWYFRPKFPIIMAKQTIRYAIVCLSAIFLSSWALYAQSVEPSATSEEESEGPWTFSAQVNALSMYEWRGYMTGGVSLQPELTLDYAFPSLDIYADLWYNHSFEGGFATFPKEKSMIDVYSELDFSLGLTWKGLDFALASYFTPLYASEDKTSFALDATLSYTFDFGLGLSWSTLLVDPTEVEKEKADGTIYTRRAYSSYAEVSFSHPVWELDLGARVGFVPWESPYIDCIFVDDSKMVDLSRKLHFSKLALEVGHTFTFNDDRFSLPVGLNVLYNPTTLQWGLQLTAGFTFDTIF